MTRLIPVGTTRRSAGDSVTGGDAAGRATQTGGRRVECRYALEMLGRCMATMPGRVSVA